MFSSKNYLTAVIFLSLLNVGAKCCDINTLYEKQAWDIDPHQFLFHPDKNAKKNLRSF